jgi:UDP-N-acetylglucosamine 2-epimerase (non-hydrolysing)
MKIILVAGARPNFMKIAPLMAAFGERPEIEPILVLVVGNVNSTIACGLVAVKLGVRLIHVEAGPPPRISLSP